MATGEMPIAIPFPRIAIVGEAWGEHEQARRQAFVGPAGHCLNGMLRHAGVVREECLITNVFNLRPEGNKIESLCGGKSAAMAGYPALVKGKYVQGFYAHHVDRLMAELESFKPTCIIALGGTALWALTKKTGIKKYRGAPIQDHMKRWKIIPTYHPAAVMRDWSLRPLTVVDIEKAKRHSLTSYSRPQRLLHLYPSVSYLWEFYDKYMTEAPRIAADIETLAGQITMISFAPSPHVGLVIPFWLESGSYWPSVADEVEAWKFVRFVYEEKKIVGQNHLYDLQYLWRCYRIGGGNLVDDTMLLQHALEPEMVKDLGSLGSFYTDEPAWKFMGRRGDKLKAEE